jgi:hypothetical protein
MLMKFLVIDYNEVLDLRTALESFSARLKLPLVAETAKGTFEIERRYDEIDLPLNERLRIILD